jgi:hypothetical protein
LAGGVSVRKPSALTLTGDIVVTAWRNAARTTQIGSAAVALPAFDTAGGVDTGVSGDWFMTIPVSDLPSDKRVYFTVSAGAYTANAGDSGTIPDNGVTLASPLPLNIYGITVSAPTNGALATVPAGLPAAVAGTSVTLTASPDTDYDFPVGGKPTVTPVTIPGPVAVSGGPPYTFIMPGDDVIVAAVFEPSLKAITAFDIINPVTATGIIDGAAKTVNITVPYGTVLTNMTTAITHTGALVDPASGAARDFTNPVTYTVTAVNGSTQPYTVTVTVQGQGTVNFPYEHPQDTGFTLNVASTVSWTDNHRLGPGDTPLSITSGAYTSVLWYLDGEPINAYDTARMFSRGEHRIIARITVGGEVYSKEATIRIDP